jgi:hypothetical protein
MFLGSREQLVLEAHNLIAIYEPTVYTVWVPQHVTTEILRTWRAGPHIFILQKRPGEQLYLQALVPLFIAC